MQNFDKWTSCHPEIDAFIQEIQLNATGPHDTLEWIPYEHLQDVKPLAQGGFARVYSATWIDRSIQVALKCPLNQEEINQLLGEVNSVVILLIPMFENMH